MARRTDCRARIARILRRALVSAVPAVALIAGPAGADPLQGEALFVKNCGTCHVISATPAQRQGPNLYGVIGRPAGKLKDFTYSKALARAKFAWTQDKLDAWLTDPARLVPGSVMTYRQADPAVRSSIIAYLEAATTAAK
jgi:cytochrome c